MYRLLKFLPWPDVMHAMNHVRASEPGRCAKLELGQRLVPDDDAAFAASLRFILDAPLLWDIVDPLAELICWLVHEETLPPSWRLRKRFVEDPDPLKTAWDLSSDAVALAWVFEAVGDPMVVKARRLAEYGYDPINDMMRADVVRAIKSLIRAVPSLKRLREAIWANDDLRWPTVPSNSLPSS
jgi:hypothetical protein